MAGSNNRGQGWLLLLGKQYSARFGMGVRGCPIASGVSMQSKKRSGLERAEDAGMWDAENVCLPGTYIRVQWARRGGVEGVPYTKHTKRAWGAWGWIPPTLPCLAVPANRNLNIATGHMAQSRLCRAELRRRRSIVQEWCRQISWLAWEPGRGRLLASYPAAPVDKRI